MSKDAIITKTVDYVREQLEQDSSGHDWWHIYRVWKTAQHLAQEEKADLFVVELAALLHDIGDWKFHQGDERIGPTMIEQWLKQFKIEVATIQSVCEIVRQMSFKGAKVKTPMTTLEGKIVQDADRLDAIGAMGIARTFAYGGHVGRQIYNPAITPQEHSSFEQYRSAEGTSINHFYEKLLLLKDRMNTKTGRKIARQRHRFMQAYLKEFFIEWEAELPKKALD